MEPRGDIMRYVNQIEKENNPSIEILKDGLKFSFNNNTDLRIELHPNNKSINIRFIEEV